MAIMGDEALLRLANDHHQKWQREPRAVFSLWPLPALVVAQNLPTTASHSPSSSKDSTDQQHVPSAVAQTPSDALAPSLMPLRGGRKSSSPPGSMPVTQPADSPTVPPHVTNAVSDESLCQGPGSMSLDHTRSDTPVSPLSQSSFGTAKPSPVWINRQAASSVQTLQGLGLTLDSPLESHPGTPPSAKRTTGTRRKPDLRVNISRANDEQPPPPPPKSPRHHVRARTAPSPSPPMPRVVPQHGQSPAVAAKQEQVSDVRASPGLKSERASFDMEVPALAQSVTRGIVRPVFIEHPSSRTTPTSMTSPPVITQADLPPAQDAPADSAITRPIAAVIPRLGRFSPGSIDLSKPTFPAPPTPKFYNRLEHDNALNSLFVRAEVKQASAVDDRAANVPENQEQLQPATVLIPSSTNFDATSRAPLTQAALTSKHHVRSKLSATVPSQSDPLPPTLPLKDDISRSPEDHESTKSLPSVSPASIRPVASLALFPRNGLTQSDLPLRRKPVSTNTQIRSSSPQNSSRSRGPHAVLNQPQTNSVSATPKRDPALRPATPVQLSPAPSKEAIREMRAQAQLSSQSTTRFISQHFRAPSPQPPSKPAPAPRGARRMSANGLESKPPELESSRQENQSNSPQKRVKSREIQHTDREREQTPFEGAHTRRGDVAIDSGEKPLRPSSIKSEVPFRSSAGSTYSKKLPTKAATSSGMSNTASRAPTDGSVADMVAQIQDLAQQSESLHTRYALLRSERQKLSTSIISSLKENKAGPDYSNTLLDQHLSLTTISSSMDICFAKLKALDCRKEEAITSLVTHIEARHGKDRGTTAISHSSIPTIPETLSKSTKSDMLKVVKQVLPKPPQDSRQHALPGIPSRRDVATIESGTKPAMTDVLAPSNDQESSTQAGTSTHIARTPPPKPHDPSRNSTFRVRGDTAARLLSIIAQEAGQNVSLEKTLSKSDELEIEARSMPDDKPSMQLGGMMLEVDIPTSPFKFLASSLWDRSPELETNEPPLLNKSDTPTVGNSDTTMKRRTSMTESSAHGLSSIASSVVSSVTDSSSLSRDEPEIGTPGEDSDDFVSLRSSSKVVTPGAKSPGLLDDDLLDYYAQQRNGSVSTTVSSTYKG